jgi:ribosome-associated translation inhibitor RaiA
MKGETIWIDAELAERLDGLWKDWQEQETDKRRFRQRKEELDSFVLLWHYIDTASHRKQIAGREGEDWVPVSNQVGAKIGKKDRSKFKEIKETLDQWGVAELDSQGHHKTHHMMVNHSDKGLVEYALRGTRKDDNSAYYLPHTGDDEACELTRRALENDIEIDKQAAVTEIMFRYGNEEMNRISLKQTNRNRTAHDIEKLLVKYYPWTRKHWQQYQNITGKNKLTNEKYIKWVENREKTTLNRNLNSVKAIANSTGNITRAATTGRLYSPFTSLRRELRKYITISGEPWAEIDISHFHPCLIANEIIKAEKEDDGLLDDCISNHFYHRIADHLEKELPWFPDSGIQWEQSDSQLRCSPRDRAKVGVMLYLNGGPITKDTKNKERKEVYAALSKHYPNVARYIEQEKQKLKAKESGSGKNKTTVGKLYAQYLQKKESELFIDQFYIRLTRDRGIPACSIHDAVLVPQSRKREARILLGKILAEQGMRAADDEGLL